VVKKKTKSEYEELAFEIAIFRKLLIQFLDKSVKGFPKSISGKAYKALNWFDKFRFDVEDLMSKHHRSLKDDTISGLGEKEFLKRTGWYYQEVDLFTLAIDKNKVLKRIDLDPDKGPTIFHIGKKKSNSNGNSN